MNNFQLIIPDNLYTRMLIPVSLYVVKNILVTKIIKSVHNVWHVLTFSMESMLRIVFKRCRPHDEYLSVIA